MQPKQWSVNGLSVELRRDRRTINRMITDCAIQPVVIRGRSKLYLMADIINGMLQNGDLDLEQERAKLTREQRTKIRLQNCELQGELISLERVERAWSEIVTITRSRFLGVPTKTSAIVNAANTIPEVESILKKAVYEALDGVHDDIQYFAKEEEAAGG